MSNERVHYFDNFLGITNMDSDAPTSEPLREAFSGLSFTSPTFSQSTTISRRGSTPLTNTLGSCPELAILFSDSSPEQENNFSVCGTCAQIAIAFSRCVACNRSMCNSCFAEHQRLHDHLVSSSSNAVALPGPSQVSIPENRELTNSDNPNAGDIRSSDMCDSHQSYYTSVCYTCRIMICSQCVDHQSHETVLITEVIQHEIEHRAKLLKEITTAVNIISRSHNDVGQVRTCTSRRREEVADEINSLRTRYIDEAKRYTDELLRELSREYMIKDINLANQQDQFSATIAELRNIENLLTGPRNDRNLCEVIAVHEESSRRLEVVRSIRTRLLPCEDDTLILIPPPDDIINRIAANGHITTRLPMIPATSHVCPRERLGPRDLFMMNLKIGRPVFGVREHVQVRKCTRISLAFGGLGHENGKFNRPWGVCCDHLGRIIVSDRSNDRIQVFDRNGKFLYKFGSHGSAPGQFDKPTGITINPQGQLVVVDKDNHRVQIFTLDGTFLRAFGEKGTRTGQFLYPWDVACNKYGQMVVTDSKNHRLQMFAANCALQKKYGLQKVYRSDDHSPRGVCFNNRGNILMTDFNLHQLAGVNRCNSKTVFFGEEGVLPSFFSRPQSIKCDDFGNIIVADSKNSRIQVFDSRFKFLWSVGGPSKWFNSLERPAGMCLTPEGNIVVVDSANHHVYKY